MTVVFCHVALLRRSLGSVCLFRRTKDNFRPVIKFGAYIRFEIRGCLLCRRGTSIGPVREKTAFLRILVRNFAGESSGFFYKCEVEMAFSVMYNVLRGLNTVLCLRIALTGNVFALNYLL